MFEEFVLTASTADLSEEPRAREHADAVEFRMDLASDPLDQLAGYDGELPLLVTNRATWEGGEAGDLGRFDALSTAVARDAVSAVDVEL
ncbi:3-dehydroquinate dehydratase, partial [Halorubrum sp. E3]